jgi:hypothetical protein
MATSATMGLSYKYPNQFTFGLFPGKFAHSLGLDMTVMEVESVLEQSGAHSAVSECYDQHSLLHQLHASGRSWMCVGAFRWQCGFWAAGSLATGGLLSMRVYFAESSQQLTAQKGVIHQGFKIVWPNHSLFKF